MLCISHSCNNLFHIFYFNCRFFLRSEFTKRKKGEEKSANLFVLIIIENKMKYNACRRRRHEVFDAIVSDVYRISHSVFRANERSSWNQIETVGQWPGANNKNGTRCTRTNSIMRSCFTIDKFVSRTFLKCACR